MSLKVVTLNMLGDLSRWEHRSDLLVEQLIDLSPDVVMLQEVSLPENPAAWLSEQLNLRLNENQYYKEFVSPKTGTWGKREGIGTLSRIPVESHESIPLGGQGRVAQKIRINLNNHPVLLMNTHLFWQTGQSDERIRQVRRLIDWSEEGSENIPVLVCGDFNDTPDSLAIYLMKEKYKSAHETVQLEEPAYTYPTPLPVSILYLLKTIVRFFPYLNIKAIKLDRRSVLDYIFVNHQVEVLDCQLVFVKSHPENWKIYASDHFGLIAEVRSIQ
jgi:endonuclease/exonuclease/phosphatase family metal-dependent hydrolase